MATVKILSSKSNVNGLINYLKQESKTNVLLQSGIECSPETIKLEFQTTKELYKKTGGRQYYHLIQSFKPKEVDADKAHKIGMEWAEKNFKGYQCFVVTHQDKDHIHNHVVVNSVSLETGKKLQTSKNDLKEFKKESDKICAREKLSVVQKKEKSYNMSQAEYKNATKGQSWKIELMKDIKSCMTDKESISKIIFISKMKELGYKVNWSDTRKYITYTTKDNKKCRDRKLPDIYSKENLVKAFTNNRELMRKELTKMQNITENKEKRPKMNALDEVINRKREEIIKQKELEKGSSKEIRNEKISEKEPMSKLDKMKLKDKNLEKELQMCLKECNKSKDEVLKIEHKIESIANKRNTLSKGFGMFRNRKEIEELQNKQYELQKIYSKAYSKNKELEEKAEKIRSQKGSNKFDMRMERATLIAIERNKNNRNRGINKNRDIGRGR